MTDDRQQQLIDALGARFDETAAKLLEPLAALTGKFEDAVRGYNGATGMLGVHVLLWRRDTAKISEALHVAHANVQEAAAAMHALREEMGAVREGLEEATACLRSWLQHAEASNRSVQALATLLERVHADALARVRPDDEPPSGLVN